MMERAETTRCCTLCHSAPPSTHPYTPCSGIRTVAQAEELAAVLFFNASPTQGICTQIEHYIET